MPKKTFKARDFIRRTEDKEGSMARLFISQRNKLRSPNVEKYYQLSKQSIEKLSKEQTAGEIDAVASEAFNYFAMFCQRKAPENYRRELAGTCLKRLGLFSVPNRTPQTVLARENGKIYALNRNFRGARLPNELLKKNIFTYDLYLNGRRLATIEEGRLAEVSGLREADRIVFQQLWQDLGRLERYPELKGEGLVLTRENIEAAVQCAERYREEREALLKFFAEKEYPVRMREVTHQRIFKQNAGQRLGYDIYSDLPQWQKAIEEPGYSYVLKLLKYADIRAIGARLATTLVLPFAEGWADKPKDLPSFLEKERIKPRKWEQAEPLLEVIPAKERPAVTFGELSIVRGLFK